MIKYISIVLIILIGNSGFAQDFESREVLDVIKKWNYASNAKSEKSFGEIYSERIMIYGYDVSREKAIRLKKSFFSLNPAFRQKIISDPVIKQSGAGVVKAEFVREVYQAGRWQKVPTYLLIRYANDAYTISGESALSADRRQNERLSASLQDDPAPERSDETPLAEPRAQVNERASENDKPMDSMPAADLEEEVASSPAGDSATTIIPDSTVVLEQAEDSALMSSVAKEVLSDEPVAVPKKYVYLLIGALAVAAVVVVLIRSPRRSSARKRVPELKETQLIRNEKTFEGFVISLFDPHYFSRKTLSKYVYAGNMKASEYHPGLEFEFQNKDCRARVAMECIYMPKLASREIVSYSANQLNRYHEFEEGTGAEVYLILGLEGTPGDPKELYLIPAAALREGVIYYQALQPFRKYGMFFYNADKRRLL